MLARPFHVMSAHEVDDLVTYHEKIAARQGFALGAVVGLTYGLILGATVGFLVGVWWN